MVVWGITDGSAGMMAQVKALALAMNVPVEMKRVTLRKPWVNLPNALYANPLRRLLVPHAIEAGSDQLTPPWPDIIISCGRRAALTSMGLRTLTGNATRYIHIQDPQVSAQYFDIVVAMEHDHIKGPNVIKTRFALHAVTPATLQAARDKWRERFAAYPGPLIAVMIGGSTNKYTLSRDAMARVVMQLQQVLNHTQGSLLITPSRRTGEENISMLKNTFAGKERVYVYDFSDENPYMGMLGLCDALIVTNDSVNMMSEAYATGKPLHIMPLPGHEDSKPARFAQMLVENGFARPLWSKIENWNYPVIDEMQWLAQQVRELLPPVKAAA